MEAAGVRVQRLAVECVAVGGGPGTDRAVRDALAGPWRRRLEEALAHTDPDGYWLIRRLELVERVGSAWTSEQVATRLAAGVVRELAARTRSRSDADVLWFPDRAAFLAHFLGALAEGRAGGRWEYGNLTRGGGIVGLAEREPDDLALALLRLRPDELRRLARVVTAAEEQRVLAAFDGPGRPALLVPAVSELRSRLTGGPGTALLLAVTAARLGAHLEAVAGPAQEIAALLQCLPDRLPELLERVARGDWGPAAQLVDADLFLPLVAWSPADRRDLAAALGGRTPGAPTTTPYGGCFLLVRLLDSLWSWPAAVSSWPALAGCPPDRIARLLTVCAVLGRGESSAPLEDPVVRRALGCTAAIDDLHGYLDALTVDQVSGFEAEAGSRLPRAPGPDCVLAPPFSDIGAELLGRAARSALALLGRSLPGMAGASPAYLWHNVLDVPAALTDEGDRVVVVLGHAPLGVLLSIAGLDHGPLEVPEEVPWTLTTTS